jgi:putative FmdB family regulatory protein
MPLYGFNCEKCNTPFEKIVRIMDKDMVYDQPCPNCGESGGIVAVLTALPVVDSVRVGVTRGSTALRERLETIKNKTHRANMTGGNLV